MKIKIISKINLKKKYTIFWSGLIIMSYLIPDLISYIYTKINQLNFKIKLYYIFSKKLF